jgi:iron complex transport system substrate-binding protein
LRSLVILFAFALSLQAEPRRIVSTAPSFTEIVYAIGAGDRLVGVSNHCHFPADVEKLPKVGTYIRPNVEAIVRLGPDLVLLNQDVPQVAGQLTRLGMATLRLSNTSLEDVFTSIHQLGLSLNVAAKATRLEQSIRKRLAALQQASAGKTRKSLLFVVGRTPGTLDGLVAVGKGSFLNELIASAGGRNVLSDSPVSYPRISLEAVLRLDPDVIIDMGDMAETIGVSETHKWDVVKLWEKQIGLKAVKSGKVYAVAADIFVVPGPRVAEAAEAFAQMLQDGPSR